MLFWRKEKKTFLSSFFAKLVWRFCVFKIGWCVNLEVWALKMRIVNERFCESMCIGVCDLMQINMMQNVFVCFLLGKQLWIRERMRWKWSFCSFCLSSGKVDSALKFTYYSEYTFIMDLLYVWFNHNIDKITI